MNILMLVGFGYGLYRGLKAAFTGKIIFSETRSLNGIPAVLVGILMSLAFGGMCIGLYSLMATPSR